MRTVFILYTVVIITTATLQLILESREQFFFLLANLFYFILFKILQSIKKIIFVHGTTNTGLTHMFA